MVKSTARAARLSRWTAVPGSAIRVATHQGLLSKGPGPTILMKTAWIERCNSSALFGVVCALPHAAIARSCVFARGR